MRKIEEKQGLYDHNILAIIAESGKDTSSSFCKSFSYLRDGLHIVISRSESPYSFGECADYYEQGQHIYSTNRNPTYSAFMQNETASAAYDMKCMKSLAKKIVLEKILGK